MMRTATLALMVLAATACGKKDDNDKAEPAPSGGEGDNRGESPAPPPKPDATSGPPFASADEIKAIAGKWSGAWTLGGSSLGASSAWNVSDGKVVEFDGKAETTLEFTLLAPCYSKTTNKAEGSSTYHKFAFDGDTLYAGLGNAGVLTDSGAIACVSADVYVLADGKCTKWTSRFDDWKSEESDCALTDGVFTAGTSKLETVGAALVNTQMKGNKATKHDSFDAAKAALAAK